MCMLFLMFLQMLFLFTFYPISILSYTYDRLQCVSRDTCDKWLTPSPPRFILSNNATSVGPNRS